MANQSLSYTRLTCDRCGFEQDYHDTRDEAQWASLNVQHRSGSALLPHGYKADLCPMCSGSLEDWWREKASQRSAP